MKQLRVCILLACLPCLMQAQTVDDTEWLMSLLKLQGQALHAHDTLFQHYPEPLCMPLVFVPAPVKSLTDTLPADKGNIWTIRDGARRYINLHHADLYTGVSHPEILDDLEMGTTQVHRAIVHDLEDEMDVHRAVRNTLSPWRRELCISLQLTQNYASDNWYQGANNTFATLAAANSSFNYKKGRVVWDNTFEWRVGIDRGNGDTLRWASITDDVLKYYSKFGLQMHPKVYGTFFLEFKTNLWKTWVKNERFLKTCFLSPIRYTMGLGIDYKPLDGLELNFSPLTYKLVYSLESNSEIIDVTEFGIAEGENILNDVGSSVRVLWHWKPRREIQLDADFYFYTNYHRIETELELTCNFIINRFLSTKIMLHPRYDSSVEVKEGRKTNIQFKEFISVGFAHTFR